MRSSPALHPPSASGINPGEPALDADPWLELEQAVARLARLALHAHSLADRAAHLPVPPGGLDPARADRVLRLRAGADLGSRALLAAVRVDVIAVIDVQNVSQELPKRLLGRVLAGFSRSAVAKGRS